MLSKNEKELKMKKSCWRDFFLDCSLLAMELSRVLGFVNTGNKNNSYYFSFISHWDDKHNRWRTEAGFGKVTVKGKSNDCQKYAKDAKDLSS